MKLAHAELKGIIAVAADGKVTLTDDKETPILEVTAAQAEVLARLLISAGRKATAATAPEIHVMKRRAPRGSKKNAAK